ncbi:MAG TPA: hypothetical protein VLG14_16195, partial [Sphingomonas sp.]|nr:hypothetical protein [Sphingomonas sp.]
MNWALLAGLIAAYAWYLRGGGVPPGTARIDRYRRWMRRAPMAFGASALAALGTAAAVVEELFFRLALPLFATLATGSAW